MSQPLPPAGTSATESPRQVGDGTEIRDKAACAAAVPRSDGGGSATNFGRGGCGSGRSDGAGSGGICSGGASATPLPMSEGGRSADGTLPAVPLPLATGLSARSPVFSVSRDPSPLAASGGGSSTLALPAADRLTPDTHAVEAAALPESACDAMDRGGQSDSDASMESGSFHLSEADDEQGGGEEEEETHPSASVPSPVKVGGEASGAGASLLQPAQVFAVHGFSTAAAPVAASPVAPSKSTAVSAPAISLAGVAPPFLDVARTSAGPVPFPLGASAGVSSAPSCRRLSEEEEMAAALRASVAHPQRDSLFTSASAIPRLAPLPLRQQADGAVADAGVKVGRGCSLTGGSGSMSGPGAGSGSASAVVSGSGSGRMAFSGVQLSGTVAAPTASSASSTRRIAWELRDVSKNGVAEGISASVVSDNLYIWEVSVSFRDASDRLHLAADLRTLGINSVVFEVRFGDDFPFSPPFLRVLRPRFRPNTTYVLSGGGLCLQVITSAGWSPAMSLLNLFISVKSTLSISSARLDTRDRRPYGSAADAMRTLSRAAAIHNWALPSGHDALAVDEVDAGMNGIQGGHAENGVASTGGRQDAEPVVAAGASAPVARVFAAPSTSGALAAPVAALALQPPAAQVVAVANASAGSGVPSPPYVRGFLAPAAGAVVGVEELAADLYSASPAPLAASAALAATAAEGSQILPPAVAAAEPPLPLPTAASAGRSPPLPAVATGKLSLPLSATRRRTRDEAFGSVADSASQPKDTPVPAPWAVGGSGRDGNAASLPSPPLLPLPQRGGVAAAQVDTQPANRIRGNARQVAVALIGDGGDGGDGVGGSSGSSNRPVDGGHGGSAGRER